ncbi:MAG TPA: hypothetical protein VKF62_08120, partial [Planctomycetota bacterium]|nr:hypothetical protein [Planctomycetota bacterium]
LDPPYRNPGCGAENFVAPLKGFPSYELYREYFRLRMSFDRKFRKEVTDDALARHGGRVRPFLEEGTVDAQVILCAALDPWDSPQKRPPASEEARDRARQVVALLGEGASFESLIERKRPPAFEEAHDRARQVVALLAEGASFDGLVDRFSEFPNESAPGPNRGRFGPRDKDRLKRLLGESEFEEVVRGYSIAEILFHDAPIGEAIGPILGPYGYYVGRVIARSPGDRTMDLSSEGGRNLVREDYLARRFLEWSNEAVSRARIEVR